MDTSVSAGTRHRFLRLQEVKQVTGLGRSTIYARVREGTFPAPVALGSPNAVGWIADEIGAWIERQIHAARSVRANSRS